MNDDNTTREDLADRLMDLALAEKAGGKAPPDLCEQILARAEAQVSLPDSHRPARAYGSFVPVGVSLCLLGLAAVSAVLWQPNIAVKLVTASRDGELLKAYEEEVEWQAMDPALRQEKLAQLVERFNSLVDESRFADAEAVAARASELEPGSAVVRTLSRSVEEVKLLFCGLCPGFLA